MEPGHPTPWYTMPRVPFKKTNGYRGDQRRAKTDALPFLTRTAMSHPHLPPEMLDYIVDLLHDKPETLKLCCLVTNSWVPRTRKHLFADIKFDSAVDLALWKKTFPDPSNSPAYYTHTLSVGCPHAITEADAEEGGWIRAFSRVSRFVMGGHFTSIDGSKIPFVPFHKFSPTLKSFRLISTTPLYSEVSNLICSFPLLEDLNLTGGDWLLGDDDLHGPQAIPPLTSPAFTGSLELYQMRRMAPITHWLLSLPGGIHFRKLVLPWLHEGDHSLTTALVERCSHTLDSLDIICSLIRIGKPTWRLLSHRYLLLPPAQSAPSDLSKATKLKYVTFWLNSWSVEWINAALRTITPGHRDIQQTSIHIPYYLIIVGITLRTIEEPIHGEWLGLDRLLVQLWESRSVRTRVIYTEKRDMRDLVEHLLPETSGRGAIDLVYVQHGSQQI